MRRINNKLLIAKTIVYRFLIIAFQILFTRMFIKDINTCIYISILWNLLNMLFYYLYEYIFAKHYDTTIQTEGAVIWLTGLPCSGKSTIGD